MQRDWSYHALPIKRQPRNPIELLALTEHHQEESLFSYQDLSKKTPRHLAPKIQMILIDSRSFGLQMAHRELSAVVRRFTNDRARRAQFQ